MKAPIFVVIILLMLIGGNAVFAQEPLFDVIAERKGRDVTFPSITKVSLTPASTAVRIEWETERPAHSYLEYGETPAYGLRAPLADAKSEITQSHRVELTGLSEFRTYHFRIRSTYPESANEAFSRALTFTTLPGGGFAESPLVPTPIDFIAPHVQSFTIDSKEGVSTMDITTDEQSSTRVEYGIYVKGSPFLFEDKESTSSSTDRARFGLRTVTPGSVYLYRLSTQDRLGNRAFLYGTFQTVPHAASPDTRPLNSVLITNPSQLVGIPGEDIWKDKQSGRLYRIFRVAPPGSTLLLRPSQLAGLSVFQIWKDEKTGRLYRHPGIPNPESKEKPQRKESIKNKEIAQNKEGLILITHPLQLKVLFPHEVWRDARTGKMYRMIPQRSVSKQKNAMKPAEPSKNYIPFSNKE